MVVSAIATLPGLALLLQLGFQLAREHFFDVRPIPAYDLAMIPISCLWWLIGPLLLGFGLIARLLRTVPKGTTLVQIAHAVSWAIASFVSVEIAIRI